MATFERVDQDSDLNSGKSIFSVGDSSRGQVQLSQEEAGQLMLRSFLEPLPSLVGKKAVHTALVSQLEKYREELRAIGAIADTNERRSRCSSIVVSMLQTLSIHLEDKDISGILAETSSLVQHCVFFTTRSTPAESE